MSSSTTYLNFLSEDINDKLSPPEGWQIVTDTPEGLQVQEETELETKIFKYLPKAAKCAERLVAAITEKTDVEIPETYLRVEAEATFHVLLLVSKDDFHVPQMAIARLLAEEFTKEETRFDIHFSFSIWTDFEQLRSVAPGNYRLKHVYTESADK